MEFSVHNPLAPKWGAMAQGQPFQMAEDNKSRNSKLEGEQVSSPVLYGEQSIHFLGWV